MAVLWKPYLSKVKRISLCVDIRLSPELKWLQQLFSRHALGHGLSQHVENSGHTDRRGRRISCHYRKEIWSLSQLCSLSPTHYIAPSTTATPSSPLPLEGLSTPLVMTMLQTALLSLGALPEPRCNSAKKKKKKKPWLKPAPGGESGVFWRKLTVCGALQPQGAPQPCLGSDTLPGKVLRWLGEDVGASGKRTHCKKHPSMQVIHVCYSLILTHKIYTYIICIDIILIFMDLCG